GGGILGAQGSHQIDLLRYFLGDVVAVSGATATFSKERPDPGGGGQRAVTSDDFASFSMRFASGAVGTVVNSAVAAHAAGPRTEIWGDDGTLVLDQERLWGAQGPGNFRRGIAALVQRHIGPPPRALLQPEHRQDRTRDFRRSIIGRPVDQGVIVFGDAEGSAPPSLVSRFHVEVAQERRAACNRGPDISERRFHLIRSHQVVEAVKQTHGGIVRRRQGHGPDVGVDELGTGRIGAREPKHLFRAVEARDVIYAPLTLPNQLTRTAAQIKYPAALRHAGQDKAFQDGERTGDERHRPRSPVLLVEPGKGIVSGWRGLGCHDGSSSGMLRWLTGIARTR